MKKKYLIMLLSLILLSCRVWAAENYSFNVTVEIAITPPHTIDDYDGLWHNTDFIINLTAIDSQGNVKDTYYKINGEPVQSLSVAGPPLISTEGDNNTLEYWSVDEFGNEELPHNVLTGIKLDKTLPSINILSPDDEAAFSEGPVTITGTAEDALSGIDSVEIDIAGDIYYPVVEPDGSFSLTDAYIAGGPNSIIALARDAARNEAEDNLTVFLGWVLHLQIPYSAVEDYDSGAACCQMILNYIRNGVADDLTQQEIYNYGHSFNYLENSDLFEMDPKAIDYALGHFDPYDSSDYPQGDSCKGYNFSIASFGNDRFNNYLKDIILWMAFPVKVGPGRSELVAWPNTPVAVPGYGRYNHWIVVNGASTDENPRSELWYTPDFTVYGLWLTDPTLNGIGQDLYVTSQVAQETYLLPLDTSDRYDGKYVRVAEPPEIESEAEVSIAQPEVNEETHKIIEILEEITKDTQDDLSILEERLESAKRHIYDAALLVDLEGDTKFSNDALLFMESSDLLNSVFDINNQAPIELDWGKIIDSSLLTDENFRKAFNGSQVRSFIKVRRTNKENSFYYLIPFDKYVEGQFLTYVAITINSEDGSFKEASWVETPTRFIQINKENAVELVLSKYPDLQNAEVNADLIWGPGGISQSPFYPYWRVVSGNEIYFVTQNGEVIK